MNTEIIQLIRSFSTDDITPERKEILNPVIKYLQLKTANTEDILLNFICTHNSRRSHLSQIWAQTMASYWNVKNVFCYSGGTETTAMYYKIAETLTRQGFIIIQLSQGENPVYAVKYDKNSMPVISFSKEYNHPFNPDRNFAAIMTCDSARENCPVVYGADTIFPVTYEDPKTFDDTEIMDQKYYEKSLEIAREIWYIFYKLSE